MYMFKFFTKFYILSAILALFAQINTCYSQLESSIELQNIYDDNPFPNDTLLPSYINYSTLSLAYYPDESLYGISYSGDFALFNNFSNRHYTIQKLNFLYSIPFGEDFKNPTSEINIITSANGRINKKDLSYYDYYQLSGYADYEYYISEESSFGFGYRARYRNYPNYKDIIYLEHFLTSFYSTAFETQTALSLGVDLGYKNYLSLDQGVIYDYLITFPNAKVRSNGNNRRIIKNRKTNLQVVTPGVIYTDPNASLLRTNLRLSQSLAEKTGLSMTYMGQYLLKDGGTSIISGTVDLLGEKELFDDPYSFTAQDFSIMLTQILFQDIKLQVSSFYTYKQYNYPSDLERSTSPDRQDTQYGLGFLLEKVFYTDSFLNQIGISFQYIILENESNSKIFDYNSNSINFAISFGM